MRTLVAAAAAASLALVTPGARPAAAEDREAVRPLQSFVFSADCIQMPGRLRVEAERVGPHRTDLALRGSGLPYGLEGGGLSFMDRTGQYSTTFDPDPRSHRVHHATSADGSFAGNVAGSVGDHDRETVCDVGALLGGDPDPGYVRIGNDSVRVTATMTQTLVEWVPCRASDPVRGHVVLRFVHTTVRTRLDAGRCDDGLVALAASYDRDRAPSAAWVEVRSAGRTWRASYRLRFGPSVQEPVP